MDQSLKACLDFIEKYNWKDFSFEKVYRASGIPLSEFYRLFQNKSGVISSLIQYIDEKMLEELAGMDSQNSSREILFEIILTRLEIASPYKKIFQKLFEESLSAPLSSLFISQKGLGSVQWMLEQAGLNPYGWSGMLRVQGLTVLYLYTLKTWFSDASLDMEKTMASLDRGLLRVEKLAHALSL
ncbi:TetR/AcrR family transcriptional regulator [Candidatus Bealeia paramacronuclearis]|uniref:TetR/AcrR family transcriptional regulator n=1 Tax=Candidatus Bealeia paramacronuclearis TaxID=1921001 RepID=A0ABZ2C538_9PROT|nr:TetR/AcrR family transcriptional regulator [Candidatus Bealeia paramacronuclearis]